jgi:hypothetical protein
VANTRICFEYDGKKYFVGDLTVGTVEALEAELGVSYSEVRVLGNMRHKRAFMRAMLSTDHPADKVDAILAGFTLDQVEEAWNAVKDDMPAGYEDGIPLAPGEPSTPTS